MKAARLRSGSDITAETITIQLDALEEICVAAALRCGADAEAAHAVARASVDAEASGQKTVGLAHFLDYLDSWRAGRIKAGARPVLTRPLPAIIHSDAGGGVAHLGFDTAFEELVETGRTLGVGIFAQANAYTCGSLGYFTARLARRGLLALAATNGPALLAGSGATKPTFCTNPLAFAAPRADGPPLLIDQASSAAAFVSIRRAAEEGKPIPEGWALDKSGKPTTDPREAMRGALLAFGGARGANIALMVEVLSAGLAGANWSLDAPSFSEGSQSPGAGLFVLAIDAQAIAPGFAERLDRQLQRLGRDYCVHIPGLSKNAARQSSEISGLAVQRVLLDRIAEAGR
ncbi:Ldh family oxidoreductase [Pseudaminobacter arsenicus]|uniref:Ldh family oxidoreductase n=1 Tax=Borborobacter arsenicus TaxID=1851146 RepID=A0A432VAK9_9HYPH|nr:Ldh family oxidoreductase [Pseudaminobacter arsenicus]RUM99146.1 Ldh family oxidoreductase [Pseudaminobacter arsenicus]